MVGPPVLKFSIEFFWIFFQTDCSCSEVSKSSLGSNSSSGTVVGKYLIYIYSNV